MNKIIAYALLIAGSFSFAQELPSLTLKDLDGNNTDLNTLVQGENVFVFSFWATWCVPCINELDAISEVYEDWQDSYDVQLVAVSIDNARTAYKVKTYVDGQDWDYLVLLDKNQELRQSLNFQTVPYTLLLNKDGEIVYRHQGYVEGDEYELEDKLKELSK